MVALISRWNTGIELCSVVFQIKMKFTWNIAALSPKPRAVLSLRCTLLSLSLSESCSGPITLALRH